MFVCLNNFPVTTWRCRKGQDKWSRLPKTDSKPLAFKTNPRGCSTKCTPNESLQTLTGHIISEDVSFDLEHLKINPKVDFSRHWFPQMGQDQLCPHLLGSWLRSWLCLDPVVSFQRVMKTTGAFWASLYFSICMLWMTKDKIPQDSEEVIAPRNSW